MTKILTTALLALLIAAPAGAADELSPPGTAFEQHGGRIFDESRFNIRTRDFGPQANGRVNGNHGPGETRNSVGEIHGNVSVGGRIRQRVWVGGNFYSAGRGASSCNTVGSIGSRTGCP